MNHLYPTPAPEDYAKFTSEAAKYRHLTAHYLTGRGLDIGTQGEPVVPWAISFDLPEPEYSKYTGGAPPHGKIDVRGFMTALPFEDHSLPWIHSSHVIEDLPRREWIPLFRHWAQKIIPGGLIVVLVPEYAAWWAYVRKGGPHNFSHASPEPSLGDVTVAAKAAGLKCEKEVMTRCYEGDYTIMAVVRCA